MSLLTGEVAELLEKLAPREAAMDWDNPGLLVGRSDKEAARIYVALDASEAVVEAAIDAGADMIVTHHPVIFHSIKAVNDQTALGLKLMDLIKNDVTVYSMHTNFDSCPGGMADLVCERLGLQKLMPMEPVAFRRDTEEAPYGIGFVAELPALMSCPELAEKIKEAFDLPFAVYYDAGNPIRRIAVCPGSGRGETGLAASLKADCFVAGDLGHHEGLDLREEGISMIDAGHYGLEHIFTDMVSEYLVKHTDAEILRAPVSFPAGTV